MSLVPLADAFNHKAAVVQLTADYAVQGASSDSETGDDEDGSDGGAVSEDADSHGTGSNHAGAADTAGIEGAPLLRPHIASA